MTLGNAASAHSYAAAIDGLSGGPPLAHWRLGEAGGPQITDRAGARHGTYSGTIGFGVAGLPQNSDNAVSFGGTGQGTVPHDAGLALAAFSLSFWFKANSLPSAAAEDAPNPPQPVISKDQTGTTAGDFVIATLEGGALRVRFQDASTNHDLVTSGGTIEVGEACHVVVRADNTGFDLHLNGVFQGKSTGYLGAWSVNTQSIRFADDPAFVLDGDIVLDEVAIYPRVVSEEEIAELSQRTSVPTAVGDTAAVPESATTAIDVVANDLYVGAKAGLTVTVVSQPSGGDNAAVNGNNDIEYTAGAVSADTFRKFKYKIRDVNGESNAATANVTVLDAGAPAPDQRNCYVESGADTVVVNSMEDLASAINAVPPAARNILIAPNTYSGGSFTFNPQGTEAKPIVVRPQNGIGTVTIDNPRWTIAFGSSRLVLSKLFFNGALINVAGSHHRITRCRFRQINTNNIQWIDGLDCRIDHCDFSDYANQTTPRACMHINPNGVFNGSNRRLLIDYNHFHDINPSVGKDNSELLRSSTRSATNMAIDTSNPPYIFDHNLFQNIDIEGEGELVAMKTGGIIFRFNTIKNVRHYAQSRTSNNCEIRSNWFENVRNPCFNIFGDRHLFIGNRFIGGLSVRVAAGSETAGNIIANSTDTKYAAAHACRVIGNRMGSGHLIVGAFFDGPNAEPPTEPARNNNLHANTRDDGGPAHRFDAGTLQDSGARHGGTTFNVDSEPFTDPEQLQPLDPADVGLAAPDPLCPNGPQS